MPTTDYQTMWKDLGMNLEMHDNLCAALPMGIEATFQNEKNRPEAMGYWDMIIAQVHGLRPAELVEEKKKGRKVFGTFCVYVPDELIIAANGIVTGLCGGSEFWVSSGEEVLPKNTCPLVKASIGAHRSKTCPFFSLSDIYIGETTCDAKKKAYEILAEDSDVYVMDLPQMKREKDHVKWAGEIAEFAKVVERVTGNKITPEKLKEAIKIINNRRKAMARVFDARKNPDNVPISGTDCLLMTQIAFFDDPERCTQMCNKLADELDARNKEGNSVAPKSYKRLMITGTPMAVPNWKVHSIIEHNLPAVVVCEEMCTGTRYVENLVDESGETLEEMYRHLADRYLKNNCACFTPNKARVEDVIQKAKDYHVDGVIDCSLSFCNLYETEQYGIGRALKEAGIPCLSITTDYADSDSEQLKTRIGAFVEMLDN